MNKDLCFSDCLVTIQTGYFPSPTPPKWFAEENDRNMIVSKYLHKEHFEDCPNFLPLYGQLIILQPSMKMLTGYPQL